VQAATQVNLKPPRYTTTREPTCVDQRGCRATADLAKTDADREATVECTCPIHRGTGGGMHEQTDSLNWGPTRRRSDPRTKKISRGSATSGSDEAIVSDDLAGQYNRPASQGPLDESVWEWGPLSCPQGPQAPHRHTGVAYKSGRPRRRSRRTSRLKPYWGKPAVRNFREGRGNTMASNLMPCCAPLLYSTQICGPPFPFTRTAT